MKQMSFLLASAAASVLATPAWALQSPGISGVIDSGGADQPAVLEANPQEPRPGEVVLGGDSNAPSGPVVQKGSNGTTVYEGSYFAAFAPATALDIARRVPGFSLDLGNGDVRGFAGAAGNVVINGARPSSKSDSLSAQLQRIPASAVARVEVGPGSNYGSDYSGKAQVLNVIVVQGVGGLSGNVEAKVTRLYTGHVTPDASGSLTWKTGASSLTVSAGSGRTDNREVGFDRLTTWPDQREIEYRHKRNYIGDHNPYGSVNWGLETGDSKALHLNLRYAPSRFTLHQDARIAHNGVYDRVDDLDQHYDVNTLELGGDVTRPLAGGAVKLVGLATRAHRDNFDRLRQGLDQGVVGGFEQRTDLRKDETIGRLSWSRQKLLGMSVELGGEVAFNKLDSDVDLAEIGPGGALTAIDLPIDQAVVSEKRLQLYANVGRGITSDLRLDAGLAMEASRLKVRGDATADRSLRFFKPSLSLDWAPKGGWHAQLSLRRTVAQLDFFDFISSAELTSDRVNGGNADLLPQQAWELRGSIERPILGDGLAKFELGYDRIDDLQDRILTPEGFDAPGNLGRGKRRFASATIDAPLASLGLKGARLKLQGTVQDTKVLDPVSHSVRGFSGYYPALDFAADFRHDLGKFAYGVSFNYRTEMTGYRSNETDSNANARQPYTNAFVEYRPDAKTSITLDGYNLLSTIGNRSRFFSIPDRSVAPSRFEYRERNQRRSFSITMKRQFG